MSDHRRPWSDRQQDSAARRRDFRTDAYRTRYEDDRSGRNGGPSSSRRRSRSPASPSSRAPYGESNGRRGEVSAVREQDRWRGPDEGRKEDRGLTHREHQRDEHDVSTPAGRDNRTADDSAAAKEEGELSKSADDEGEEDYELQTAESEAQMMEERRKRRQAILQKHVEQQRAAQPSSAAEGSTKQSTPADQQPAPTEATPSESQLSAAQSGDDLNSMNLDADGALQLGKDVRQAAASAGNAQATEMSAAEYDPQVDRALDNEREEKLLGEAATQSGDDSEYEEIEVEEDEEIDDLFAIDESTQPKKMKTVRVKKNRATGMAVLETTKPLESSALHDNWDEPDGYYRITLGERIGEGGRYQVFANLGRGMFSAVVKARDTQEGDREVAIKVIRSQESMYKAGIKEMAILQRLAAQDPDGKRHVIRLLGQFEYRNHLCMVFESLSMNLRELIRRFGKDVGLNLRAVRTYAHQMFLALTLMRKADIMHADLKPDNVLVNESKTVLKVCDLGSAADVSEADITPYLVSRFYRAPEIILGLPYDCALDMWSVGCTLFELCTGRILFPGKTNNHMLLLMQELKGKFTTKQIRKGRFSGMHFDDQNAFVSRERDRSTGSDVLRKVATFAPGTAGTDLRARLLPASAAKSMSQSDLRLTNSFIDLLGRTLELDPARRITPHQALQHPFFSR